MTQDHTGKVAVVTGGGRGIGRAIVLELARLGTNVVVNYLRNADAAEATAREAQALGVRAVAIRAHMGDPPKVERLFEQIGDLFGRVDFLINNAASGVIRSGLELDPHHWDWTMNINARGAWLASRAAVPLMEGREASIVNISSLGSQRVLPEYIAIGVSKAALEAVTRYLAVELAARNISVNAVAGGLVETEALRHFPRREQMLADARSKTPAGRMVEPEDIAQVAVFLCSSAARMIRGQVIVVDGGFGLPT